MLGTIPNGASEFSFEGPIATPLAHAGADRWDQIAASAILVLGSPRSGTTWLAKVFDSHPDILYRHEPDELTQANPALTPAQQIGTWLRQRGLRSAAKRPYFKKSWRPMPWEATRRLLASMLAATQHLKLTAEAASGIGLPDLIPRHRSGSMRAAVKLVNWDGILVARSMPDTRCVFILRHPCGQIASILAGLAARRFSISDFGGPVDLLSASALAAQRGIGAADFQRLPDAGQYAWAWLAFNEPAVEALRSLPNARIVVYEDLCHRPHAVAQDLFAFAGLGWARQTEDFLGSSTRNDRSAGYFDVYRETGQVADRWRQTMSQNDQDAVRAVVRASPLARCWPDLAHGKD